MKVAMMLVLAFSAASCNREPKVAAEPAVDVAQDKRKVDPILGEWVCIADNGGGFKGTRMVLNADGVATFTYKGKTTRRKYKQEPGSVWMARRNIELDRQGILSEPFSAGKVSDEFTRPGVVMVYFQSDGQYVDYGGGPLTYVPEIPVLYNFLTQAWCRPGDEKRVGELMSK